MTLMLESRMPGNWHVRFGGGESEKCRQRQLVGFLSYTAIGTAIRYIGNGPHLPPTGQGRVVIPVQ
jgi:hypothetical protein